VEEQLTELTAALKLQFQRHCFIQIRQQETQPMLVPLVEPVTTFTYDRRNLDWYIDRQHQKQQGRPAGEIDRLLAEQETALLQAARTTLSLPAAPEVLTAAIPPQSATVPAAAPIWNRAPRVVDAPVLALPIPQALPRKRGPKPDTENHSQVANVIRNYGETWTADDNLIEICEELDRRKVPVPKTWLMRKEGPARSWSRGRQNYPHLVIKAIKDRCKAVEERTA
jgi:hypothetical protein